MRRNNSKFWGIKITNINANSGKYKRCYSFCGIKFKFKNKEKTEFFIRQRNNILEQDYQKKKDVLNSLKKYREGKSYLLTVYVLTYNQETIISKCLDSILEQKTIYPYLIKILDDGSTDKTFDVCLEYAKKHPDKIELNTVKHNSGGKLSTVAYENISTKYFCRIDGNDYWCNENKIQISLDFLESNPDYVTYAHDTAIYNLKTKENLSSIHDVEPNKNITNEISFDNFFYIHVSSRIHRNVLDFKKLHKTRKRDRILWYLFLDAGKCYYDDRIMAVYTIGPGWYNKRPGFFKYLSRMFILYKSNKYFHYKYDVCFTKQANSRNLDSLKKIFGVKFGWLLFYYKLKYINTFRFCYNGIKKILTQNAIQLRDMDRYSGNYIKADIKAIELVRREII